VRLGLPTRAVAVVALLLSVSACGSEPEEGPLAEQGDGSSPSASATPTVNPPEAPPATDDEAGRRAFAQWFVQALAYGNRTNDAAPILERAIKDPELSCSVCEDYQAYLADRESHGISYQPSTYAVKRIFKTGQQQDVVIYDLIASEPAGRDVKKDGTVVKRYPARRQQLIEVGIRFRDGAYEISGWKVGKGAQG
jgi:hypothetical protein